jgi:hypothetical protein
MSKRLDLIKKIDAVLTTLLTAGNEFIKLVNETDDKELQVKLLEGVVLLSYEVQELNTFLILNTMKYADKDIIDSEFFKLMEQLEKKDKDGNK